jgi:hypothetical protein
MLSPFGAKNTVFLQIMQPIYGEHHNDAKKELPFKIKDGIL